MTAADRCRDECRGRWSRTWSIVAAVSTCSVGWASDFVPEQAVVQLQPGIVIDEVNADYGTTVLDWIPAHRLYLLDVAPGWTEDALEQALEADPRIAEAELNETSAAPGGQTQSFYFHIASPEFYEQSVWSQVGLDSAQTVANGAGVVVAVLDTGLEREHAAFASTNVLAGYDFVDDDAAPDDVGDGVDTDGDALVDELVGHGTFSTAIIAHMAPGAAILPIRVLDGDGHGEVFRVVKGIYLAVDRGAHVINLSLGMMDENEVIKNALEYARDHGVVTVAAAGNMNQVEPKVYPAAASTAIGITAIDADDLKCTFSNYGGYVDLCAPGLGIVSAVTGNAYGKADGTSGATAVVAGAVALVRSAEPGLDPTDVEDALRQSSVDVDGANPAFAGMLGAGRLDVGAAVEAAQSLQPSADLNGDDVIDAIDYLLLIQAWGATDSDADFDGSGVVDALDLLLLIAQWS